MMAVTTQNNNGLAFLFLLNCKQKNAVNKIIEFKNGEKAMADMYVLRMLERTRFA